jgi:hypothetical protein
VWNRIYGEEELQCGIAFIASCSSTSAASYLKCILAPAGRNPYSEEELQTPAKSYDSCNKDKEREREREGGRERERGTGS